MIRASIALKSSLLGLLALLVSSSAQAQIPDFAAMGEETPYGVTHDGTNLWISDYDADKLFKLDASGQVIQTLNLSFTFPRGMAWHGGILFVTTGSTVRRVDPTTGNQLSSFGSPDATSPNHQGLCIGDGKLWIVSRGDTDDRIYGVDPATGTSQVDFAAPGTNPRGIFYHDGSLWNLDSSSDLLYQLSPTDGTVQASYPIPLGNPRGLIHHDGSFWQIDNSLDMIAKVDITNDFSTKAISQSQYPMPSGLYQPYTSSHPIDQANSAIKRILFYQHGVDDNAPEYFARGLFAARQANKEGETLVITLQLLDDSKLTSAPPANQIYWTGSRFWGGLSASSSAPYPRATRHSSYEILDHMLGAMTTNASLFPNLEQIVISGHSGGGQFANRYAVSSAFQTTLAGTRPKVNMKYIVMNPSSYVYLNPKRVDQGTLDIGGGIFNFVTPTSPDPNYDNYGYGLDNLYSYQSAVTKATMLAQYPGRKVVYLMGEADTGTGNLDQDPEAMLQGSNRYERSQIYYAHLRDHYGDAALPRHRFVSVPGVGHSGFGMITSPNGLLHHFEDRMKLNINPTGGNTMQLAWTGGEGTADVEVSTNLVNWTPLSIDATSPFEDTITDMGTTPKQFYRLVETTGP